MKFNALNLTHFAQVNLKLIISEMRA